jgi:hypothetical protein
MKRTIPVTSRDTQGALDLGAAIREHPFATVLVAVGVGYVLGGGLFTSTTRRLVGLGMRAVLLPAVTQQLEAVVAQPAQR